MTAVGMSRTSEDTTYPNMNSCSNGMTMMTGSSSLSRDNSRNSFQISSRIRRRLTSPHPPSVEYRRDQERDGRVDREPGELGPEHGQPGTLEEQRPVDRHEVPRREEVRDELDQHRHVADREDEVGQQ